jgi:tetratricopeptide (TPR) repeat protein/thymidylate kinase
MTPNSADDARHKNIVYNSTIITQGNVHIGNVHFNVTNDFHHAILFLKLEKTEEEKNWSAQLSIKSKHYTINQLLHQKVKVDIAPALFKQVAGFQEVRRLNELTFRGLGHITPENIRIEEEYLAQQIFDTFFQGDILTVCQDFIALLEKRKISELMLAVSCEDNAVVNLPFEMVIPKFFPEKLGEKRQSLAVNHFGFVRTLETSLAGFEMQGKPSEVAPLKLLFVTALPENLNERSKMLEIEEEQKRLIDAIGSFEATGGQPKLVIEFLDTASLREINDALQKHRHHIVHISGHGSYNEKTNQGVLHLEDDEGKHLEVTGAQLGESLRQHECVKLLILSACETAVAGNGVVEQLATFGIPALVAMRFSVTDEAAKVFTTALYATLSKGETLTLAIAQAREALWQRLEEQRRLQPDGVHLAEWFTPITYLNQYTEALVNLKDNYVLPEDFYPRSDFFKTKNTRLIGAGFVGRKRYLNQLRRHFAQGKHVCLHGLGGLGKTTLAEAFANNYDNQSHELLIFRGGNQLLEKSILDELLARLESDDKANKNTVRHLKNYLETDAAPTEKLQSLITNYLQNRKTILVFDNFEDVQRTEGGEQQREIGNDSLREFYQYLCQNTPPNCHILFTSRYTIADLSTTITHLSLDKMTYAEQYRLSNFSPTLRRIPMSDRQEVFKRLDGHPRAYEFLEALLKNDAHLGWENVAASVGKVESQVVENLLLTKIYDRLSPDAQQLLQMASVFITRTPLAALEHLNPPTGTATLATLSDWSLCFLDDNEHFEIHRLTREWVTQQKIPHDQCKAWALKAGDYFKDQPTFGDLNLAKDYYLIAEEWKGFAEISFFIEDHLRMKGLYGQAYELSKSVLEKQISDEYNSRAYSSLGIILQLYGQLDNALSLFQQSLKITQEIGDRQGEATTLNNIGQIYAIQGDNQIALKYSIQSLKIHQEVNDRKGEGRTLNNIGHIYSTQGEYQTAQNYLIQSLKIHKEVGNQSGEGAALDNIGQIYSAQGDYKTALIYLKLSLKLKQEIGDRKGVGASLNNIAITAIAQGDYQTASKYLESSLKISQEIGDRQGEASTLNNIGQIYSTQGDYQTGLIYLLKSLKITQGINDRRGECNTLNNIGQIYSNQGDYQTALKYLEPSLKISQEIGDRKGEGDTLNNIGHIHSVQGDYQAAILDLLRSLKIAQEIGNRQSEGAILNNLAAMAHGQGDNNTAYYTLLKKGQIR